MADNIQLQAVINIAKINIPDLSGQFKSLGNNLALQLEAGMKSALGPASNLVKKISELGAASNLGASSLTKLGRAMSVGFAENQTSANRLVKIITVIKERINQSIGGSISTEKATRSISSLQSRIENLASGFGLLGSEAKEFASNMVNSLRSQGVTQAINNIGREIDDLPKRWRNAQTQINAITSQFTRDSIQEQSNRKLTDKAEQQNIVDRFRSARKLHAQFIKEADEMDLASAKRNARILATGGPIATSAVNNISQRQAAESISNRREAFGRFVNNRGSGEVLSFQAREENVRQLQRGLTLGGFEDAQKAARQAERDIAKVAAATEKASFSSRKFGDATALALKRYSAFVFATFGFYAIINAFRTATAEAIEFEHQMTKIEQVIGSTRSAIIPLEKTILDTAKKFGNQPIELAKGVQTLAQAGFDNIEQLKGITGELAKIPLTATFGSINETVEGLIAIFGQFNLKLTDTARIFDIVNQFAAKFAIESKDIFEAVRRGGSAFSVAGGTFEEFVKVFSVVGSITKESPSALGTFLKTQVTHLLRPASQKKLQLAGIESVDLLDQLKEISGKLFGPDATITDPKQRVNFLSDISGNRNISRFISLLQGLQRPEVQEKIKEAIAGAPGSVDTQIIKRLDDLGFKIKETQVSFKVFVQELLNDDKIRGFLKHLLDLVRGFVDLASSIKSIIPTLASLGTIVAAPAIGKFFTSFLSHFGLNLGTSGLLGLLTSITNKLKLVVTGFTSATLAATEFNVVGNAGGGNFGGGISGAGIGGGRTRVPFAQRFAGASKLLPLAGLGVAIGGSAIGGTTGSTITGAGTGIALGAILGSAIPLIGTVVGAAVGGLVGAMVSLTNAVKEQTRERIRASVNVPQFGIDESARRLIHASPNLGRPDRGFSIFTALGASIGGTGSKEQQEVGTSLTEIINAIAVRESDNIKKSIISRGPDAINLETLDEDINKFLSVKVATVLRNAQNLEGNIGFSGKPADAEILVRRAVANNIRENIKGDITDFKNNRLNAKDILEDPFSDFAISLQRGLIGLADKSKVFAEEVNHLADQLNSIITDINQQVSIKIPSSKNSFLRSVTSNENIKGLAGNLGKLFEQPEVVQNLRQLFNNVDKSQLERDTSDDVEGFLRDQGIVEESIKTLSDTFKFLSSVSTDLNDNAFTLAESLIQNTGSIEDWVAALIPGSDALDKLIESEKQDLELFNQRLALERQLTDAIRNVGSAIFESTEKVYNMTDALSDVIVEQEAFVRHTDSITQKTNRAGVLLGRSGQSQFGSTNTFISDLISSANKRNSAQAGLSGLTALSGIDNNPFGISKNDLKNASNEAQKSQSEFSDKQLELSFRLSEFDKRIGNAAKASQLLQEAFNELNGQIENAGKAVTSFTGKDLADSFQALDKFLSTGFNLNQVGTIQGIQQAGKGLESLTQPQFSSLEKLLSAIGSFNLGNGISGSDILGDITKSLGLPLLGAVRSRVTGESQGIAEQAILQNLQDLQQKQKDAAAAEQSLRQQQIDLAKAQTSALTIEQQFYKDQLQTLSSINLHLDSLDAIRDTVNKLYNTPLPVIISGGTANTLEVKPIQVNVALSAPDILKLAGDQLYSAVMAKVSPAIAEALGVVSEEAKNTFQANAPLPTKGTGS